VKQSEIRSRIADALDDPDNVFWSEAQLNKAIDEGAEVLAEETHAIRRSAFCPLRQGVQFYFLRSIAQDIMMPYRIWNHDGTRRLVAYSMREMDAFAQSWMDTTGTPDIWFPVSWDFFGIYPKPASGGGVLRVDYYAWPRELLDDDDEPEFLESIHEALTAYGLYEGELKQWNGAAAKSAESIFMSYLGNANDKTNVGRVQERSFQRTGLRLPDSAKY